MTDSEAVATLRGMMEDIKRKAGPALGILNKHWPLADISIRKGVEKIYEHAKHVQDEVEKL